jgi:hypothetical protein
MNDLSQSALIFHLSFSEAMPPLHLKKLGISPVKFLQRKCGSVSLSLDLFAGCLEAESPFVPSISKKLNQFRDI